MKKSYCTQNNGDCLTCSLNNYGRDCMNQPMPDKGAALAAILDRAADRIGRDDPELIAVDLITEIRRAGLYGGMNRADSLGLKKK